MSIGEEEDGRAGAALHSAAEHGACPDSLGEGGDARRPSAAPGDHGGLEASRVGELEIQTVDERSIRGLSLSPERPLPVPASRERASIAVTGGPTGAVVASGSSSFSVTTPWPGARLTGSTAESRRCGRGLPVRGGEACQELPWGSGLEDGQ